MLMFNNKTKKTFNVKTPFIDLQKRAYKAGKEAKLYDSFINQPIMLDKIKDYANTAKQRGGYLFEDDNGESLATDLAKIIITSMQIAEHFFIDLEPVIIDQTNLLMGHEDPLDKKHIVK